MTTSSNTLLYWFRNDLRLADNPALLRACGQATHLLPVFCMPPAATSRWGFERVGPHRRALLASALQELRQALSDAGSRLLVLDGPAAVALPRLVRETGATGIVCEEIAAPEEMAEVATLRQAGIAVQTHWQSTLLVPAGLPFTPADMPNQFTEFRRAIEKSPARPAAPLSAPAVIPPPPEHAPAGVAPDEAGIGGGEASAIAHLARYFGGGLPHTYKSTRDQLHGADFSTGFSRWLWSGAISARAIDAGLRAYEDQNGATDSSYWIRFELLWRDHFRFLHLKHGAALYRQRGLLAAAPARPAHDEEKMRRWREGATGQPLVDAGMRELAATGFLSNRMRQIVASYLIYELECDWRAGAAWFEARLTDYDVYSNHGNWLYIAGRGTDPRGGRRFDPERQARIHDPDGIYQRLWSNA
nr:DASH family cryptochrome [uncultured Duganella sp.]